MVCKSRLASTLGALLAIAAGYGCGASEGKVRKSSSDASSARNSGDAAVGENPIFDHVVTPPAEYYDALFADALQKLSTDDEAMSLASGEDVLFLNFDGAEIKKGFQLGQSFLPCQPDSTIPPSGLSPADRATVLAGVKAYFQAAGAKLTVTETKPATGDFTTVHVGGTYADLGCVDGASFIGVAPFDKGNANRNDIGFAFLPTGLSLKTLSQTISHEAAHSYGLGHVTVAADIMHKAASAAIAGFAASPLEGSGDLQDGPKILQQVLGSVDGAVEDGEDDELDTPVTTNPKNNQPGGGLPNIPGLGDLTSLISKIPGLSGLGDLTKLLPGLDSLGAIGKLLPGLGSGGGLDLSKIAPQLSKLFSGLGGLNKVSLPGLDKIFTILGVASQSGATASGLTLVEGSGIDVNVAVSVLLGKNGKLFDLSTLISWAGGGKGQVDVEVDIGADGRLPDLSALLDLKEINDFASLLHSLFGSGALVKAKYAGAEQEALLSLVKVAYTQQYQRIAATRSSAP